MPAKAIPEGYHTATPYLVIDGAAKAIEFYAKAFGAEELLRIPAPEGKIGHAEIKIGDSILMLADEFPALGFRGPTSLGGTTMSILLYVTDVDAAFARALRAGGKELRPVQDQFYGDRSGTLADPFGHVWSLSTHKEDVPLEELRRRANAEHGAGA